MFIPQANPNSPAPTGDGHRHEVARAVGVGPTLQVGQAQRVEFTIRGDGMTCMTCGPQLEATLDAVPWLDIHGATWSPPAACSARGEEPRLSRAVRN